MPVGRVGPGGDGLGFQFHLGFHCFGPAVMQQTFGRAKRAGRSGSERGGKLGGSAHQPGVRDDLIDNTPLVGFLGRARAVGQDELCGPFHPHRPG